MIRVEIAAPADSQIRKLDPPIRLRMERNVRRLASSPELGKPLQGPLAGLRSMRVGDYRIVYKFYAREERLVILRVAHRSEAYRGSP